MRIRSRQSARSVRTQRSAWAFAFGARIGGADQPDALGPEDFLEGVAELPVPIMDQKPERLLIAKLHEKVARLLRHPASVGIRAAGDVLDPPRRERDEEQHVDSLQEGSLDGEEVAGKHAACRLRAQKHAPGRVAPLRRRRKAFCQQHFPHRGRRHKDAHAL